MTTTVVAPAPTLSHGSGSSPLKRHIVARGSGINWGDRPLEPLQDVALCGATWDRANATKGEICGACVAEFKRRHPGWPVPG